MGACQSAHRLGLVGQFRFQADGAHASAKRISQLPVQPLARRCADLDVAVRAQACQATWRSATDRRL